MCLILVAWQSHPDFPLVVAANRDEFFARPTAAAHFWPTQGEKPQAKASQVFAGRDLQSGGTWMGVTSTQRFAALTNYRDPSRIRPGAPSRGQLVADFLTGDRTPADYCRELQSKGEDADGLVYNGYNLLTADGNTLVYQSNLHPHSPQTLAPGIYGLCNHLLDTPWPKVVQGKSRLASALSQLPDQDELLRLLLDEQTAEDTALPRTGVSLEWERLLSAAFVRSPTYGTRSASVYLQSQTGPCRFLEVSFDADKQEIGRVETLLGA